MQDLSESEPVEPSACPSWNFGRRGGNKRNPLSRDRYGRCPQVLASDPHVPEAPPIQAVRPAIRFPVDDEDARVHALKRFRYMVFSDLEATQLGMSLASLAERAMDEDLLKRSFSDAFRTKAASALTKRCGALMQYFACAMRANIESPFMASGQEVYAFMQTFRQGCGVQHRLPTSSRL